MKFAIAVLLLFALVPGIARSQSSSCLDRDPDAVLIGSSRNSITLCGQVAPALIAGGELQAQFAGSGSQSPAMVVRLDSSGLDAQPLYATKAKTKGQVSFDGFYYSVRGQTGISIPPGSIEYIGDPNLINAMSTADLFDLIGQDAVKEALANGTIPCSVLGVALQVKVSQAGCVIRYGTGESTHFVACNDACCLKTYTVTCSPLGVAPLIQLVSAESNGCSGGDCESTCR
ncbi:MAG: hypothetical protein JWQ98_1975 [Chlorobi bacterium]|nr:hypothetical protein [Chlorobiota bacterium]